MHLYLQQTVAAIIIESGLIQIQCKQSCIEPTRTLHPRRQLALTSFCECDPGLATDQRKDHEYHIS